MNIDQVTNYIQSIDISKRDKDNLLFLMSIDNESLENWYSTIDTDDKIYAYELLSTALSQTIEDTLIETEYKESLTIINTIKSRV